jgi:hypothetical protein
MSDGNLQKPICNFRHSAMTNPRTVNPHLKLNFISDWFDIAFIEMDIQSPPPHLKNVNKFTFQKQI